MSRLMKKITSLPLLFICWQCSFAQTEVDKFKIDQLKSKYLLTAELNKQFLNTDFAALLTHTENENVYGFIGSNYQRIRVKILSLVKNKTQPDVYDVLGKSMVKGNVDSFSGTLHITNIRKTKVTMLGVDDEYKDKGIKGEYVLLGNYKFYESKDNKHSGIFTGVFQSDFYLDKNGKVQYDDIEMNADGYTNNQFIGTWTQYGTNTAKRCNWGDYRIPNSGDLDSGAGEFSPTKGAGWETVNARWSADKNTQVKSVAAEKAKWWK